MCYVYGSPCVEGRGQLSGTSSLLSRDPIQAFMLGIEYLSHPARILLYF